MKNLILVLVFFSAYGNANEFNKQTFESTLKTIQDNNFYQLTDDEIYQAAIAGVLKHIETKNGKKVTETSFQGDANSLLGPRNRSEMKKEMKGELSGIGVGIRYDKDKGQMYPILEAIIEGGGAQKANLKKGDQLIKIDGQPVNKFESFKDIVYAIRGKNGSRVKLTILRDGETFTKKVKRQKLSWDAVEVSERTPHSSIIKINFFNEKTVGTLKTEISKMIQSGKRKLILDLRKNTGGLFDEGLKAIKLFAKKDQAVLITKLAKGESKTLKAEKPGIGRSLTVVVLISQDTKSMGEAFASSLRQLVGATIIGQPSFGKGTMETVVDLENNYSVKFTVGKLYSPDDKTWNGVGVLPDIEFPASEGKTDAQLSLAKTILSSK